MPDRQEELLPAAQALLEEAMGMGYIPLEDYRAHRAVRTAALDGLYLAVAKQIDKLQKEVDDEE